MTSYNLTDAWKKLKKGDSIGDTELCRLIDDLRELEHRLMSLGPAFSLAWKEVMFALRDCEGFAKSRGFHAVKIEGNEWHSKWFPTQRKAVAALGPDHKELAIADAASRPTM